MTELPKAYTPRDVEGAIYERWLAADVFAPDGAGSTADPALPPFTIIQPPPNVTGSLHLGHAQRTAVEDLMARHARMRGHATLFLPGLDHASIAAQFVLDGILAKEGESRQSLGRERYLERMVAFSDSTKPVMLGQQRRVGASADWGRLRYTMDEGSAAAVRVAFDRLYRDGLAYRTEALVNWCPGCRTSVSDLEVIPTEETGTLWSVRYHLIDEATGQPSPTETITVATTRPETILGDTAVAVHPDDERYRALVGRTVRIPFVERDVPVIADDVVQRAFGTGAVKITPAHDPDDHATGLRHGLPAPTILADDASVTGTGTAYDGLDRYEARTRILADLAERGDLAGEQVHPMVVGRCQRSDDVLEPRLKTQWFIRMTGLAERALDATRSGRTRILPERFDKTWEHWLTDIRDWNVSRQLWWGHRIPAWYCPDGHVTVTAAADGPDACDDVRPTGRRAPAGPRHLRHLVQQRAVAVLDPRLAGRHARPAPLLPDLGHGDRLRHHLLLGRPDDDARAAPDRSRAVPHDLPVRAHPRPGGQEDVQDQGQRHRPAGGHRRDRRRRPALRAHPRRDARPGPALRAGQARERPQLRQQAVERDALRRRRSARPRSPPTPSAGCPTSATSARPSAGCCRAPRRRSPRSTRRWPTSSSARSPGSCTTPSGASTATGAWSWPRSGWPTSASGRTSARPRGGRSSRSLDTYLRLLHPVMPFVTEALWAALPHRAGGSGPAHRRPLARGRGARRGRRGRGRRRPRARPAACATRAPRRAWSRPPGCAAGGRRARRAWARRSRPSVRPSSGWPAPARSSDG